MKKWTDEELEILRERFPAEATAVVAEAVGHSYLSTMTKAKQLGLKKTPERIKAAHVEAALNGWHKGAVAINPVWPAWLCPQPTKRYEDEE